MADVDSAEIPILIDEEIHHIQTLKDGADNDRIGNIAMKLMLISNKGSVAAGDQFKS